MSDQIEVDYDRELETMIEEMQAGRGRFDHLTTIARVVYTERQAVTNFAEHQGKHIRLLEALVVKVDGIDSKVDSLQTEVGGLRTEVGSLQTEVGGLRTEVGGLRTEVGGLQTEVGGLRTEIGGLQTEVGGLR